MSDDMIQVTGTAAMIRDLRRMGATQGDIAKQLTIATSITARQLRRRADRFVSKGFGQAVKRVPEVFPTRRKTVGGVKSSSFFYMGFRAGIPMDKFKTKRIGGRRGRSGYSVRVGRTVYNYPSAFALAGEKLFKRVRGSRLPIERIRSQSPAEYVEQAGGISAIGQYARQRLLANVKGRLFVMLRRYKQQRGGNGGQ